MIRVLGRSVALLAGLAGAALVMSRPISWTSAAIAAPIAIGGAAVVAYLLRRARVAAERAAGMTPEVRSRWAAADSLADVAELTAQWLTGDLPAQPGYFGPVDVDADEVPGLAGLLAAVCRAGFLTTGSQAGTAEDGWQQHAAVEGLIGADGYRHLQRLCQQTGMRAVIGGPGVTVTFRNGKRWTTFGAARRDLGDSWTGYGICGPGAVRELRTALRVVVYDPQIGGNDRLWPVLATFAHQMRARRQQPANGTTYRSEPQTGRTDG